MLAIGWYVEHVIEKPLDMGIVMWRGQLDIQVCSSGDKHGMEIIIWGQDIKVAYGSEGKESSS